MNLERPLIEAIRHGARSRRNAMALSAAEMHAITRYADLTHEALGDIRQACRNALEQGGAISPESLLAYLTDNDFTLEDTDDGTNRNQAENQGRQPAGAAEP